MTEISLYWHHLCRVSNIFFLFRSFHPAWVRWQSLGIHEHVCSFVLTPTESDADGKPMLAEADGRPIPADPSTDIPAPGQGKKKQAKRLASQPMLQDITNDHLSPMGGTEQVICQFALLSFD